MREQTCLYEIVNICLIVASGIQPVKSAESWEVPAERIEVSSPAQNYSVSVQTDEKHAHQLRSVRVVWNGRQFEVPAADLGEFQNVRVHSLRVITDRPMRIPGIPQLNNRTLAICLEYGDPVSTLGTHGEVFRSYPRVLFQFMYHGYDGRGRHVPIKGTNRMKLFGKDPGKDEYEDGEATNDLETPHPWPTRGVPLSDAFHEKSTNKPSPPAENVKPAE